MMVESGSVFGGSASANASAAKEATCGLICEDGGSVFVSVLGGSGMVFVFVGGMSDLNVEVL